jgi:dTDP-4-amino-4,6-dideoxygalactose transaminase
LNLELLNKYFPRMFPLVPLAVPYWSRQTYRNILRCLVAGEIIKGPDLIYLHKQLVERFRVPDLLLCGSGSLALELALRVCDLKAGDEVIIPSFCCSSVVAPILAVGATPVLSDVGRELNLTVETVEAVLTRKSRAVVVPHLYGNPADIDSIAELANTHNIVVIDDAAQAVGATIDDRPAGSCGDMGVVSFGAEKVCSGLGGGALMAHSTGLVEAARQMVLRYPSGSGTLQRLTKTLLRNRWRRWTLPFERMLTFAPEKSPEALPQPYRQERLANLDAAVARSLIDSLSDNLSARRARVDSYCQLLGNQSTIELINHGPGSACLTQVMRVLPQWRGEDGTAQIIGALAEAGYEVQGSYVPIHLMAEFPQCVWDRLPYTEQVWGDLIELPCEPDIDLKHLEDIAAIIKRIVSAR